MPRQLLVMLALLACGSVPDRIPMCGFAGAARLRDRLCDDLPNRADYERTERGYYELLTDHDLDHRADLMSEAGMAPPMRTRAPKVRSGLWSASVDESPLVERVDDLREIIFRANGDVERSGVRWTTNSHGMRDREYATEKPARTFRIALVGDSIGAGWGVDADARFESILEEAWNSRSRSHGGPAVEILNCAVPGHSPGQRWTHFTTVGLPMKPDLIIYEATTADIDWDERRLRVLLARGVGWDSHLYSDVLVKAGARPGGSYERYKRILRPWRWELLAGVYGSIASECKAMGIPVVWILVPRVGRTTTAVEHARLLDTARSSGFLHVVDASRAFDGRDPSSLTVDVNDYHPNDEGHALLATRLDRQLSQVQEIRSAWESPAEIGPLIAETPRGFDPSLVRAAHEDSPTHCSDHIPSGADPR